MLQIFFWHQLLHLIQAEHKNYTDNVGITSLFCPVIKDIATWQHAVRVCVRACATKS